MKIIYKNTDNSVSILTPTKEALSFATIEQIAQKDVPHGLPYWIVEDFVIPEDRTFRDAWEVDDTQNHHGFGSESCEFDAGVLKVERRL